jgi:hypothetical protein
MNRMKIHYKSKLGLGIVVSILELGLFSSHYTLFFLSDQYSINSRWDMFVDNEMSYDEFLRNIPMVFVTRADSSVSSDSHSSFNLRFLRSVKIR